ncbi:MAG TPA: hypothetical protein VJ865_02840 [Gemmatimonadaceae bacterium]|nr:hypothetical protein [Gemmatimonadaceae bacterium]
MLGERLRHQIEQLIANYSRRLRSDPVTTVAKNLPAPLVEDHAMSYFGDLFQTLVVLEKSDDLKGREESALLTDGSQIQRLISELHGRQRHQLGWTEEALHREYEIMDEEVVALVKRHEPDKDVAEKVQWAIDTLKRMLKAAHDASFNGYQAAAKEVAARTRAERAFQG